MDILLDVDDMLNDEIDKSIEQLFEEIPTLDGYDIEFDTYSNIFDEVFQKDGFISSLRRSKFNKLYKFIKLIHYSKIIDRSIEYKLFKHPFEVVGLDGEVFENEYYVELTSGCENIYKIIGHTPQRLYEFQKLLLSNKFGVLNQFVSFFERPDLDVRVKDEISDIIYNAYYIFRKIYNTNWFPRADAIICGDAIKNRIKKINYIWAMRWSTISTLYYIIVGIMSISQIINETYIYLYVFITPIFIFIIVMIIKYIWNYSYLPFKFYKKENGGYFTYELNVNEPPDHVLYYKSNVKYEWLDEIYYFIMTHFIGVFYPKKRVPSNYDWKLDELLFGTMIDLDNTIGR